MGVDAYAKDDLLFLAILSTSVVDAIMAIREGSTPEIALLNQAKEMVKAVAENRFYALPETAFPGTSRQLQTIHLVWTPEQIGDVSRLIEDAIEGTSDSGKMTELMTLFGRLGRRALRQMSEPVLLEETAVI